MGSFPCVCGVFLSGQFVKGSHDPPKGNAALLHEHPEPLPCNSFGNKQCTNKCLDLVSTTQQNTTTVMNEFTFILCIILYMCMCNRIKKNPILLQVLATSTLIQFLNLCNPVQFKVNLTYLKTQYVVHSKYSLSQ